MQSSKMFTVKSIAVLFGLLCCVAFATAAEARVFNTEHGRWTIRDPLGYVDGMNQYEYAGSRPVVRNDPAGLCPLWPGVCPPPVTQGFEEMGHCQQLLSACFDDPAIQALIQEIRDCYGDPGLDIEGRVGCWPCFADPKRALCGSFYPPRLRNGPGRVVICSDAPQVCMDSICDTVKHELIHMRQWCDYTKEYEPDEILRRWTDPHACICLEIQAFGCARDEDGRIRDPDDCCLNVCGSCAKRFTGGSKSCQISCKAIIIQDRCDGPFYKSPLDGGGVPRLSTNELP